MERLVKIQNELKAPKGQFNSFGKYKYRSCEDIVEAVKPLLNKYNLFLLMKDELVQVWERYYIESVVELHDANNNGNVIAYSTGYAREEETKKGMDWSQITGASSSYARKYALCWLLAIDDGVDSDSTNKGEEKSEEVEEEKPRFNKEQLETLKASKEYINKHNNPDSLIESLTTKFKISKEMRGKIADLRAELKE